MVTRRVQRGFSLLELVIASLLAAIVVGTLLGATAGSLRAQATTRDANEMVYQARFAIGVIVAKAQASPPKVLATPPANTSGDWFAPTMYCLHVASSRLVETTTADTGCTGTRAIADNVTAFKVERPAASGAIDTAAAAITLTVANASRTQSLTMTASARLGGGTS